VRLKGVKGCDQKQQRTARYDRSPTTEQASREVKGLLNSGGRGTLQRLVERKSIAGRGHAGGNRIKLHVRFSIKGSDEMENAKPTGTNQHKEKEKEQARAKSKKYRNE